MFRSIWLLSLTVFVLACGGGDGDGAESGEQGETGEPIEVVWPTLNAAPIDTQTHMTELVMDGVDGCLSDSRTELSGEGYTEFVAGGMTSGGSVEAWWVVHHMAGGNASDGEGIALQVCEGTDCTCHMITPENAQTPFNLDLPVVGAPVLLKSLQGTGDDGSTALGEITGALIEEVSADLNKEAFLGKRRLVIANAYGPVFDVDFSPFVSLMEASGLFTEVEELTYVTAQEMDHALSHLHNQDVLIWFGAAVRQSKGAGKFKPEGMTVNRAVYGDETYSYERIEAQLSGAPLGGPGLVVLMGGESFGTTLEGMGPYGTTENLINSLTERPTALIGFEGGVATEDALHALRAVMESLVAQESFATAISKGNALISGAKLISNLDDDSLAQRTLGPSISAFWGESAPSAGEFVGELLIGANTQCIPAGGGAEFNPIEHTLEFFTDIEVQGPFFWGAKQLDDIDFEVFGVLGNLRQGGDLRFWISGQHVGHEKLVVLGDGVFCEAPACTGSVTGVNDFKPGGKLFFEGSAQTSTYVDENGATCRPSGVFLTQKGGKPGWIIIDP